MVTEWGMSEKVGPISYASDKEIFIGRDMASHVTYSEATAAIIDDEVQKIIMTALEKARKLLKEHKSLLDVMARVLVERETIFSEEVDMIMEGKSAEEVIDFMDNNERTLSENPFARKAGSAFNEKTLDVKEEKNASAEESSKDNEKSEDNAKSKKETSDKE